MDIEKITWGAAGSCLRVTGNGAELIVSLEFGPRVLFCGVPGGRNMFRVFEEQIGSRSRDQVWRSYGGHRFWHAPERAGRTYYPDNEPIQYAFEENVLKLVPPPEKGNQVVKELHIQEADHGFRVVHRTVNVSPWPVELAPWGISVMAPGGEAILPQEPFIPHGLGPGQTLLPARPLVLWPFTPMGDARFTWGSKSVRVREGAGCKLKIGAGNRVGWAAYLLDGSVFVKRCAYQEGAKYPDMGCSFEIYTESGMLELESLGPLAEIQPGAALDHVETWELFDAVPPWLQAVR